MTTPNNNGNVMKIDKKKDDLLADYAIGMLKDFYLNDHEDSPQEGYARAAKAWSTYKDKLDDELAERLYGYVSNKWFMFLLLYYLTHLTVMGKERECQYRVFLRTCQILWKVSLITAVSYVGYLFMVVVLVVTGVTCVQYQTSHQAHPVSAYSRRRHDCLPSR